MRNIHFCVIQLTWSSQWKVFLKCRENLWQLSWMKFILKFPGPPGKPSLPKVSHLPPPRQNNFLNSSPSSCHHSLGRRKLLIPPGSIILKICFPQQQRGGRRLGFATSKFGFLYFVRFASFSNVMDLLFCK